MFGKKKDKGTAVLPAGLKSDGSDSTISKVQGMGMEIVSLRAAFDKAQAELAARANQVDALQQGLDMANGRVAILEGVVANTFNSVMGADKSSPTVQAEPEVGFNFDQ